MIEIAIILSVWLLVGLGILGICIIWQIPTTDGSLQEALVKWMTIISLVIIGGVCMIETIVPTQQANHTEVTDEYVICLSEEEYRMAIAGE